MWVMRRLWVSCVDLFRGMRAWDCHLCRGCLLVKGMREFLNGNLMCLS